MGVESQGMGGHISEERARLATVSQVTDGRGSQEELEGDQMAYLRGPWHVCVGRIVFSNHTEILRKTKKQQRSTL